MNSLRDRLKIAGCRHKHSHMRFSPYESEIIGPTIEVCDDCGASRSHSEFDSSPWLMVDVSEFKKAANAAESE